MALLPHSDIARIQYVRVASPVEGVSYGPVLLTYMQDSSQKKEAERTGEDFYKVYATPQRLFHADRIHNIYNHADILISFRYKRDTETVPLPVATTPQHRRRIRQNC